MTHVVHVIAGLGLGGAERMLSNLVGFDRPQKPRQTVINLLGDGDFGNTIKNSDVALHSLNMAGAPSVVSAVWRLSRLMKSLAPDAIQSWMYNADLVSYWAWRVSGLAGKVPLYWGVRCSDMDFSHYGWRTRRVVRACVARSARVTGIVANSRAGAAAHERLGYAARSMMVIENGVDTAAFRPDAAAAAQVRRDLGLSPDRPMALHVARIDPMKDHSLMLAVAQARPDIAFVAIGSGTEAIQGPANVHGLGPKSALTGYYTAADVAILTSAFGEGFPNVLGEAMACGTPVVTTDVGDAARVVGTTGKVTPPGDSARFADALDAVLAAPASFGDPRARIADRFTLQRAVARFDALHARGDAPHGEDPEPCAA